MRADRASHARYVGRGADGTLFVMGAATPLRARGISGLQVIRKEVGSIPELMPGKEEKRPPPHAHVPRGPAAAAERSTRRLCPPHPRIALSAAGAR